jgi:hypothetical protein
MKAFHHTSDAWEAIFLPTSQGSMQLPGTTIHDSITYVDYLTVSLSNRICLRFICHPCPGESYVDRMERLGPIEIKCNGEKYSETKQSEFRVRGVTDASEHKYWSGCCVLRWKVERSPRGYGTCLIQPGSAKCIWPS